jgi:predicted nucleic acid-binding protein
MILVDTSVWADYFNGRETPETATLDKILSTDEIVIGDIILAEVLQGFRSDPDFEAARQALMRLRQVAMLNPELAVQSARNYRQLRKAGITIRKTLDCLIATYCIENQVELLHCDRDFDPFAWHLGLRVVM